MSKTIRTRIIGLGNPILGDDGVGWKVAEKLEKELDSKRALLPHLSIDVQRSSLGGLSLMEQMIDTDAVILIDAIQTGMQPVGSVHRLDLDTLPNYSAAHTTSPHDTSLQNAIRAGKLLGADLPEVIRIVAIEANRVYEFSEQLSPQIEQAIPIACQAVWDYIFELEENK